MKFIVGNWKMNGNMEGKEALLKSLKNLRTNNKVILCLPFTLLYGNDYGTIIGAQDISEHDNGAYTGDISGQMLKDADIKYVIVGHSERRTNHNETNAIVKAKATAAIKNGIIPIICIGENATEKNSGRTMSVIKKMLLESVPAKGEYIVAYEPRWAIGSGKTPTDEEIAAAFETIAKALHGIGREDIALLYGGSVNATNAQQIAAIKHVNGLLVGGASLKSDTFLPIIKSID
jgi:triosephosphate isomerase